MDGPSVVAVASRRVGGLCAGDHHRISGIPSADALRPAAAMEGTPAPCLGAVVSAPPTQEVCDALVMWDALAP